MVHGSCESGVSRASRRCVRGVPHMACRRKFCNALFFKQIKLSELIISVRGGARVRPQLSFCFLAGSHLSAQGIR